MKESVISTQSVLLGILVGAAVTFGLRALPFAIFGGSRKVPDRLVYLGKILPSAIMAVLIVYCLKDVAVDFKTYGIPELLAAAVVAVTYKWKHNTLVSILFGTICNMVLLRVL